MNAVGKCLWGSEFLGQDLSGATFDGCDLSRQNLSEAKFEQCDFSGAVFEGAVITDTDFCGVGLGSSTGLTVEQLESIWNYKNGRMKGVVVPNGITMTQQEFDEFMQHRKEYQQTIRELNGEAIISAMPETLQTICRPFVYLRLPDQTLSLCRRQVTIRLNRDDVHRLVKALPYFPKIGSIWVYFGDRSWEPGSVETRSVPNWLLEALRKLPYLEGLTFEGGTFDHKAMVTIAGFRSLRRLYLGECRVAQESFAELEKLTTLEVLHATTGLTPDCFITLAKLPRFRAFGLMGNTDDFDKPIDAATQRAIESLDGRLESFCTSETSGTIHASVVRALLKVRSLQELDIESVGPGLTLREVEQLAELPNLTRLQINVSWPCPEMSEEEGWKAMRIIGKVADLAEERRQAQERSRESR